jgi:hypothetical protein
LIERLVKYKKENFKKQILSEFFPKDLDLFVVENDGVYAPEKSGLSRMYQKLIYLPENGISESTCLGEQFPKILILLWSEQRYNFIYLIIMLLNNTKPWRETV